MKVMIVKELMTGDVSPVAMFKCILVSNLWLPLALSGCLWLSEFAYKALAWLVAWLVASLLRYSTLISPGVKYLFKFVLTRCIDLLNAAPF